MKTIRMFWSQNPESNVTGYTIIINNGTPITVDVSSPLEVTQTFNQGDSVLFSIVANASNGPSSDPSSISFIVPIDNNKPSPPSGLGWEVVE